MRRAIGRAAARRFGRSLKARKPSLTAAIVVNASYPPSDGLGRWDLTRAVWQDRKGKGGLRQAWDRLRGLA